MGGCAGAASVGGGVRVLKGLLAGLGRWEEGADRLGRRPVVVVEGTRSGAGADAPSRDMDRSPAYSAQFTKKMRTHLRV